MDSSETIQQPQKVDTSLISGWRSRSKEIAFFTCIAGMSVLGGFATTVAMAKKKDPGWFAKGLAATREVHESGGSLAMRALARGSLYAVGGFTLFCLAAWTLSGVSSMSEFRQKTKDTLPSMRKHEPQGRSEFASVRELVHYLMDEDERVKDKKKPSS